MTLEHLKTPALGFLLLLAAACDKSNSLGEVGETEKAAEESSGSGGSDTASTTGSGSTTTSTSGGDTGVDPTGPSTTDTGGECPPNAVQQPEPAGCPGGPAPQFQGDPGCYELCATEGEDCGGGTTCTRVQINPCPCPPDAEACCDACGAEELLCMPDAFDAACGSIVSRSFRSIEEYECGQTPEGVALCHWQITFDSDGDGTFLWMYSDVGEGGVYACADGTVTTDTEIGGTYDAATGVLTWDGIAYEHSR